MAYYLNNSILLFLTFCLCLPQAIAQEEVNQYDNQGKRHGSWKEYYDSQKEIPKFEGEFFHGKEIGLFKFYKEGLKQPTAIMDFEKGSDTVAAKFLTQDGKTISEGNLIDKKRVGTWTYYHKDSDQIMMTENYIDGILHGPKKVYYEDGSLAEEAGYVKGKIHGERKLYSEKGIVLEDLIYENGELHGPAKFYNAEGELMSEGSYKNNKHHGTWRYYEDGNLKEEKEF